MTPAGVRDAPPYGLILPFFLAAPLGLVAAGVMLALAGQDSLTAINTPELLAATHAAVLGWLSLSIMGAIFQLGPVLFGGRLFSLGLVRFQVVLHVTGVAVMVGAFGAWRTEALAIGGALTAASFLLFLVLGAFAIRWFVRGHMVRQYASVALSFLAFTAAFGLTYALALHYGWFPLTMGRIATHAHLGLAGFLAIMLMGLSYQLVPMFQLSPHAQPRFARAVLPVMTLAVVVFTAAMWANPGPLVRVAVAALLAAGAVFWMADIADLIHRRSKRAFDIQGRATIVSLGFLALTLVTGVVAAFGEPASLAVEHQRLQLGYGILAVGGWAGATLVGNSYKIVPFLVWNGRFRELIGRQPVPTLAQLLDGRLAHLTLWCLSLAVLLGASSAVAGWLVGLRLAGVLFAATGTLHFVTQLLVVTRRPQPVPAGMPAKGVTT